MQRLLINIACTLLLYSCGLSQIQETNGHDDMEAKRKAVLKEYPEECSKFYPFNSEMIDLEILKSVVIDILPATDFKQCSKYAHRFNNPIADTIFLNGREFALQNDKEKKKYLLHLRESGKTIKTIQIPVENPLPDVHEYYIHLFPYKNNVILYMEDMYTTHYLICKYDWEGNELMRKEIEHTFITHPEPSTDYLHRYLYFTDLSSSQMIFTSHMAFTEKLKTAVLNLDDFTVKEYRDIAHGLILDEKEQELVGFVTSKKDYKAEKQPVNFEISMIDGKKYEFSIDYANEACEFLMKDSLLYIGNYHPISTGSSLHCFDLRTGKIKWTADVLQVNASHSEYWNKVTLSLYKDKLIMQGDEAYGSYLQIFDSETGKRLADFGLLK